MDRDGRRAEPFVGLIPELELGPTMTESAVCQTPLYRITLSNH